VSSLTDEETRAFRKHVAGLNALIGRVRKRFPGANYYLDGAGSINLMADDHLAHPDDEWEGLELASEHLRHSDGGDW
jgi:hypothetical protein